ncbi:MAG: hypothetical protein COA58_13880 [Bacteroidetes bacterium]|nr:MAG: hypothetical protein COA58_13880 [Bacteroidota bacterium]
MRFKIGLFCILWHTAAEAQTDNEVVNQYIEQYLENTIDEIDIQQFASDLLEYYENPLDINKADASELFAATFLDGFQALEIIKHRKRFGNFISIYELQILPSFSTQDIHSFLPFITIKSSFTSSHKISTIWKEGKHQFLALTETSTPRNKGSLIADTLSDLSKSHYTGSSLYHNLRYRFDYKRLISFGINMEKDANEPFFKGENTNGFDYYSFYFAARDIDRVKMLNLGDFQANFGQGLTLSTGLAFGKSSIITNSKRNFDGFGAYRSLRENAYLRGGAIAFQLDKLTFGTFVSYKKVDGNIITPDDPIDNEHITITTNIQEDGGLHRTPSELQDKDAISDFQTGFYLDYKLPCGRVGTVNYYRKLGASLEPNIKPYNQFSFRGNRYYKNGIYYDLVYRNANIYGEVSHSSFEHAVAQVHGALVSLNRVVDLSFVYRNYDKSYITLQSSGFGEGSNAGNERGFYSGFQTRLNSRFTLLGYYDLFTSPWLRFAANAPTSGNDFWAELHFKPSKKFRTYYRYRTETKQRNFGDQNLKQLTLVTTQRHRLHLNFVVNKGIELRNRLEWSIFEENGIKSFGSLMYQDVIYKPLGSKLHLSGRVAYSVMDRFENRIYSFEQVPLYDYPLFTHGFSGFRFYVLTRYKFRKGLDLWLRYGYTQHDAPLNGFESDYTIGSGLQEIAGNKKQTFTLQVRYLIQ